MRWFMRLVPRSARRRHVMPRLETLENRVVPATTANEVFVAGVYDGLLARPVNDFDLRYWDSQFAKGATRGGVVKGVLSSPEFQNHVVDELYESFLDRPAELGGLVYWTDKLAQGWNLEKVVGGILGADEFYQNAGNTDKAFLEALYQTALGRDTDATALSYWGGQLTNHVPRGDVAFGVVSSAEAQVLRVTVLYHDLLRREPSTLETTYWVNLLNQTGGDLGQALQGFFASAEFNAQLTKQLAAVDLSAATATSALGQIDPTPFEVLPFNNSRLTVDTTALRLSAPSAISADVTVRNTGDPGSALNAAVRVTPGTDLDGLITVETGQPDGAVHVSAGQSTTVTVSVDATGLDSGTYTGSIVLSDFQADNSPVTVNITLTV